MEQGAMQGENAYMEQGGNANMEQGTAQGGNAYMTPPDEVKAARKHFSKLGGGYLAGTIAIFAVQLLALEIAKAAMPGMMKNMDIYLLVTMMPMYLIAIPFLVLLVRRLPAQTPQKRTMKPGQFAVSVIMAFALMYVANIIGTIITTIIGLLKRGSVGNTLVGVVTSASPLVLLFIVVICAPVIEEFVFRKLVVDRTIRYGQGTAVVLSGLMFGLFHGNLNQFVYATALGMFLAFLYAKTGKLKITIAIHMMVNFMGSMVSTWVIKIVNLEALMSLNGGDMRAVIEYLSENMLGFLVYMLYAGCIFGIMIAGVVLLIVSAVKKRFRFERGSVSIPKGKRFGTVILNLGMGLYCVFWIGMIIYQLFV